MVTASSLPFEVFLHIFDYVGNVRDLVQCRLVCKRWDPPAEYAMFGKQLTITYTNSLSFYYHLHKKPANAQRIKFLCFDIADCTDIIIQILRLAITPSIERIDSKIRLLEDRFYKELIDIGTATKLTHLKAIPCPYIYYDLHDEAMFLFKDTLEELYHGFGEFDDILPGIFDKLIEFKNLKRLSTYGVFKDIAQLNTVLHGASQLQELEIHGQIDSGNLWTETDVENWLHDNVQVVPSLTKVRFLQFEIETWIRDGEESRTSPWLLEYLTFKYPNIDYLKADAAGGHWVESLQDIIDMPARVSSAVCKLPSYDLMVGIQEVWDTEYDSVIGDINIVKITYTEHDYEPHCGHVKSLVGQHDVRTTEFHLVIGQRVIGSVVKDASACNLIQEMTTKFTSAIKVDLTTIYHYHSSLAPYFNLTESESILFFKTLQFMSPKQTMQIAVRKLKVVPEEEEEEVVIKTGKKQLNELEICCAVIERDVLTTLSQLYSTINMLKFTCCSIGRDEDTSDKSCINIPSTKLRQLVISYTLQTKFDDFDYAMQMKQKTCINRTTYILLNMDHGFCLTFKLCFASNQAIPISFREYTDSVVTASQPVIHIICQSLEHIAVCLDHVSFSINVQKHVETAFDALYGSSMK